jgi:UPF0176 protein
MNASTFLHTQPSPNREGTTPTHNDREIHDTGHATRVCVIAFYRFVSLNDCVPLQSRLSAQLGAFQLRGTILLAPEGINAMLAGREADVRAFLAELERDERFAAMPVKFHWAATAPFRRTKVRIKQEIVTSKDPTIDPRSYREGYLDPQAWDDLLRQPNITLIDVRNDYEYALGHFEHAINPSTRSFGEFERFVREHLTPEQCPTVAMYCTGGIRCEKAAVIMKKLGFDRVYQLHGGILRYLEHHQTRPVDGEHCVTTVEHVERGHRVESCGGGRWQGDCYVFDERVAVDRHLRPVDRRDES